MFESFPVDIEETDEELVFIAKLPGFSKEEIMIKATEKGIHIAAQHKKRKEIRKENYYKSEKSFGAVERALTFPVPVNPNTLRTEFKNGILTASFEKKMKKKIGKKIRE